MGKNVFVSADWKESSSTQSCDKIVVDRIRKWRDDGRYGVNIRCTDEVHNTVLKNSDCRRCEIKEECGGQIDWSSVVIVVIGDNTATKSAGSCDGESCSPAYSGQKKESCKNYVKKRLTDELSNAHKMSYLEYEIKKAVSSGKKIILVFNSMQIMTSWIPSWYVPTNEVCRVPFWKDRDRTQDCYHDIKVHLQ